MATIPSASAERRLLVPDAWRKGGASHPADSGEMAKAEGGVSHPADSGEMAKAEPERAEASSARSPRIPSPVEATAALLRGRYTALVIWKLFWGGKRFYQLVRELEGVPRKAIAHELEELERAGVLKRFVARGPGKVEYRLTPSGEGLKIVVGAMYEWGLLFRPPAEPAAVAGSAPRGEASH